MDFNYLNIIQMIKSGQNPQQLIMNFLENQMGDSPILAMAKNGDHQGIEQFARNLYSQRGMDFDKEFTSFRKTLNI